MKKITATLFTICTAITLFAQGYYIEMKLTSDKQSFSGNMKLYFQDNNSRGDIAMNIPELGTAMNFSTLSLASNPGTIYMLDEQKRTYTEIKTDADESYKDYPQSEYEVTVLGKETVNGYNATHVNVKRKSSKTSEDMWMTTDIVDYADYAKIKSKYTGKDNLNKALEAKGAAGFPVRIKTVEQGMTMQIDVVKAEKKTNPASSFTLDGYKKAVAATSMPAGLDVNELMKNMQNMTPEQMEQFQKQMEEMYKPK
ncbi:MAG: DUF4412 domain-containing protein [Chitinophagales bacterium]|nr:DUF4412 domain-containing protein [Chitinophagales bacterium]